jgi:hypothetical protein
METVRVLTAPECLITVPAALALANALLNAGTAIGLLAWRFWRK